MKSIRAFNGVPMDCGPNVRLCGALVLQTGLGIGSYSHPEAVVHGLWPQTGAYGDSLCVPPKDTSSPSTLYSCYQQKGQDRTNSLSFEQHEWKSHGLCSGADNADQYFTQVCDLSSTPLTIMNRVLKNNKCSGSKSCILSTMSQQLTSSGYEVFATDPSTVELQLSACATSDGRWVLAPVAHFPRTCAGNDSTGAGKNSSGTASIKESASVVQVLEYGLIEVIFLSLMFAAFLGCKKLFARHDRRTDTGNDILYDPIVAADEAAADEYLARGGGGGGDVFTLRGAVGPGRRGPAVELTSHS